VRHHYLGPFGALGGCALTFCRKNKMMRKAIQVLVDALLVLSIIALVPFAWIMRDGMGPDSVTTSGGQAISRCFMTFYSGPILIGLIAIAAICHCTGKKKQEEPAEQSPSPYSSRAAGSESVRRDVGE
jgi:TRAP-type C4-dicarboxylate transport system permease small subunit